MDDLNYMNCPASVSFAEGDEKAAARAEFERQHEGRDLSRHHLRGTYVSAPIAALWNQHLRTIEWLRRAVPQANAEQDAQRYQTMKENDLTAEYCEYIADCLNERETIDLDVLVDRAASNAAIATKTATAPQVSKESGNV